MSPDIRETVRQRYAEAITRKAGCCGSSAGGCCSGSPGGNAADMITANLYSPDEINGLPESALSASFGCGNPTALADLHPGEVVLDLGSGAGLDVLLSARRVGPWGKAYGLDMTDEMLSEARANQARAGVTNAEFLKGHIEDIPLPENSVDVIISNCVINLSADKDRVLKEAYRVLRPGGRFAVSDIVLKRPLPQKVRQDMTAWAGCVAGALLEEEYIENLSRAGFTFIEVETTRVYDLSGRSSQSILPGLPEYERAALSGSIFSAFIRARKAGRRLEPGVDYIIRPAKSDDYASVHGLLEGSGLPTTAVRDKLTDFLVADFAGEAVAVVGVESHGTTALIRSLAVRLDRRKSGIAGTLMDSMLGRLRREGIKKAFLLTNTAEKYMQRRGFTITERSEIPGELIQSSGFDTSCPSCSTCMKLEL